MPRAVSWEVEEERVKEEKGEKKTEKAKKSQVDEKGEETGSWAEIEPKHVKRMRLIWRGKGPEKEVPKRLPKVIRAVLEEGGRVVELDVKTGQVWIDGERTDFTCHPNAGERGLVRILRADEGLLQFSECAARIEVGIRDSDAALNPTSILVSQCIGTQVRRPDGRLERRYVRLYAETGEIEFREEVI